MRPDDLCWLSATELAATVRTADVPPVEVAHAVLERIDAPVDPEVRGLCAEAAKAFVGLGAAVDEAHPGFDDPFTFPFAMTGQPAISVPCGTTADGLPVGLQLVGRRFAEATVLRAAAAFEAARPWNTRRPEL